MADLKTLCMDGSCMNVPQGGGGGGDYTLTKTSLSPSIVLNEDGAVKSTVTEDILLPYAIGIPKVGWEQLGYTTPPDNDAFFEAWLKYITQNYKNRCVAEKQILAMAQPSSYCAIRGYIYPNNNTEWGSHDNLPRYSLFTAELYGGGTASKHIEFGTADYVYYYRMTDSNTTVSPSDANPLMDGTATPGTSAKYAREGHRHPTDTTRAPLASPALTGTPTAPTNGTASTSSTQIATTAFTQNAINRRLPKSQNVSTTIDAYSVANQTYVSKTLYTAPSAGLVIASLYVQWASNSSGTRLTDIQRNGNGTGVGMEHAPSSTSTTSQTITIVRRVASGDVLTSRVYQSSGGALQVRQSYFIGYFIPD